MSLNIKNPEAHELAHELAALTGESMATAVTEAIRERLTKIKREKGKSMSSRLLEIGKDCASRINEPYLSISHGELLYDDRGLPK